MSAIQPSFTPASRTHFAASWSTDIAVFWAATGLVALTAAVGAVEVALHLLG